MLIYTSLFFFFFFFGGWGCLYSFLHIISHMPGRCTTWTLTKRLKKLGGNYTRMLQAILKKSWWQHPTKHQLYGHLPPITKTIQVRQTRHAGHCWRSKDELISDVFLWTPTYGQAKAERPARTYIQQLCEDMGCSPEDLPEVMNNREKWWESGISVLAAQHDDITYSYLIVIIMISSNYFYLVICLHDYMVSSN